MVKKPALGKGLSALLPTTDKFDPTVSGERVRLLAAALLSANPHQPREAFDGEKLAELAESIKQHGVMQPLLVAPQEGGGYTIVAGERRFRAALLAGLSELPCIVRQFADRELAELALIENIQREDLSALEEAAAMSALIETHGYTQEDLAARLGKSRPYVANTLRLLKLAPQERKLLAEGSISAGHARALLSLADAKQRSELAAAILKQHLSVRQAEELATRLKEGRPAPQPKTRKILLHQDIARQFSGRLGVKVQITGRQNRGRVIISYNNEDDLQNIVDAILRS